MSVGLQTTEPVTEPRQPFRNAGSDMLFVILISAVACAVSIYFNGFERFALFAERHESFQLDEIATFLIFLTFGLCVFTFRRWREASSAIAEFQQAQKQLQESNRELEQFAYVASHDLQEPLRVIGGFAELLGRRYQGRLDSDADEYIQFMLDGCKRMQSLISSLLSYSRVGRKARPFSQCELSVIVERAKANVHTLISENHATVKTGLLPKVYVCEDEMVQLFQNLIGNACKFHGKNPPLINIHSEGMHGGKVRIAVADNGIGIEKQYQDRIFKIFERLHSSSEYQGTGIGLAICKKIAERHSGQISVSSEPGVGTTFYLTLPTAHRLN